MSDSLTLTVEYDDLPALCRDLRGMGEGNALSGRDRHFTRRGIFRRAQDLYAAHFPGMQKPIRATFELVTLTGWAPSSDQPQPLRPGSARARLADALGTDETPLPD